MINIADQMYTWQDVRGRYTFVNITNIHTEHWGKIILLDPGNFKISISGENSNWNFWSVRSNTPTYYWPCKSKKKKCGVFLIKTDHKPRDGGIGLTRDRERAFGPCLAVPGSRAHIHHPRTSCSCQPYHTLAHDEFIKYIRMSHKIFSCSCNHWSSFIANYL